MDERIVHFKKTGDRWRWLWRAAVVVALAAVVVLWRGHGRQREALRILATTVVQHEREFEALWGWTPPRWPSPEDDGDDLAGGSSDEGLRGGR